MKSRPSPVAVTSNRPITIAATVAGLLVGYWLRVWLLGEKSVWWDEGLAVWAARQPLSAMAAWTAADVHPPLYFALLHYWRLLVGDSEFAIRYLSVGVGVLTLAVSAAVARRVGGGAIASVVAIWLVATSRFEVWWSQEARMYALAGLLVMLIVHATLSPTGGRRRLVVAVLANAALLWTLYLGVGVLVVQALHAFGSQLGRRPAAALRALAPVAGGLVASVLAFAPWLAYMLPRTRSWSVQEAFDSAAFARLYGTLLATGVSTNVDALAPIVMGAVAAVVALTVLALVRPRQSELRPRVLLLAAVIVVPPILVWALTVLPRDLGYAPKPEARYLLPFATAFYVLAAVVLEAVVSRLAQRRLRVMLAVGASLLLGLGSTLSLPGYYVERVMVDDYRSAAATLRAYARTGDAVLLHSDHNWPVFAYHWSGPFRGTPSLQAATDAGADYLLSPLWQQTDALWLVVNDDGLRVDKDRLYERWLMARATRVDTWRSGGSRLVRFARTAVGAPQPHTPAPAVSGATPRSTGAVVTIEQPVRRLAAGSAMTMFAWVRCAALPANTVLAADLGDPPVASTSASIGDCPDVARVQLTFRVPPDAPSDTYPVRVTVGGQIATAREIEVVAVKTSGPPAAHIGQVAEPDVVLGSPPVIGLVSSAIEHSDASSLTVRLRWRSLRPVESSLKVFVHAAGPGDALVAQRDDYPGGGQRPTTTWLPGDELEDVYTVVLPAGTSGTDLWLYAGLYDPTSGDRLGPVRVRGGAPEPADRIPLGQPPGR